MEFQAVCIDLRVEQNPRLSIVINVYCRSNPVLQGEIAQAVIPIDQHQCVIEQKAQRNGDDQDLKNDHGN